MALWEAVWLCWRKGLKRFLASGAKKDILALIVAK